jgi:Uma2 family endonuclease
MLKYLTPLDWLPTAEDLLDSDEKPVDSELQERIPNLLSLIVAEILAGRTDWFFGIDMGIYYSPDEPAVVPDAFLSIGVDRVRGENLRLSYVLWEEKGILPQLVLEVVSKKYRGEYSTKKELYRNLGIQYYVIYNPRRRVKPTLEIYQLIQGQYVQMLGNRVWLPAIGLGLGKERLAYQEHEREWLFWYDEAGNRYPTPQERAEQERQGREQERQGREQERQGREQERQGREQERQRADLAEQRASLAEQQLQRLAEQLRAMGIESELD